MNDLKILIKKTISTLLLGIIFSLYLFSAHSVFAQGSTQYRSLAPIQTETTTFVGQTVDTNNLNGYLNNMFKLGIAVAGALAVVMIILGGVQYMSSDAIGKKEDGKKKIGAAMTGLIVALGSFMLLNTLSPDFLSTKLTLNDNLGIEDLNSGAGDGNITYKEDLVGIHYDHYDNGTIQARYKDGTIINYDNENESTAPPTSQTPINSEDMQKYKDAKCTEAKDKKDGTPGLLTPMASYINDNASKLFPGTQVISTFRSQKHNDAVGGAKTSRHLHGDAVDIADGNANMNEAKGKAIVAWAEQNGQSLGIRQIIFQNTFYNSSDGVHWTSKGGATGHMNHVHIGGDRKNNPCG